MADIETFADADITLDGFQNGRLMLRQPRRGHRAGHDALLLAAAVDAQAGEDVVEFGAGVGASGLALARRVPGIKLTLIEIDPSLAELARQNADANAIAARIVTFDVAAEAAAFAACNLLPDTIDHVIMNPPFNVEGQHRPSPDNDKRRAHLALSTTLADWTHAARRLLRPGGHMTLIWRAEGIADVLEVMKRGFGGVTLLPIYPRASSSAIRVIFSAVKGGRAPLKMAPGIELDRGDGLPCAQLAAALAGLDRLPLTIRRA